MVIPAPGFDPAQTLQACQDEKVTSLYGVPTMFIAEWSLPNFADYDLSTVRTGIMAGSPCPAELMKKLIASGIEEMTICYGMTETSPVSTQTRTDDSFEHKVGTVGRVGPHLEIKVVDPATGETLPRGEPGEFCTKGYSVMLGYWEQQDKTDEVLAGRLDAHRRHRASWTTTATSQITGRIKDMVIRGGENVYPREIEEFLYTHPDILDAQVIGVPDERYGEELCAWVRMREGADAAHRRGGARVRDRQARALQDPALRPDRRRVPDDRDGQGPQGRDAGEDHRRPGARDRGPRREHRRAGPGLPPARHTLPLPRYAAPVSPDRPPRRHMRVNCAATGLAVSAPAAGARPRRLSVTLVMMRIRQTVAAHAESRADDEGEDEVAEVVDRAEGLADANQRRSTGSSGEEVERRRRR